MAMPSRNCAQTSRALIAFNDKKEDKTMRIDYGHRVIGAEHDERWVTWFVRLHGDEKYYTCRYYAAPTRSGHAIQAEQTSICCNTCIVELEHVASAGDAKFRQECFNLWSSHFGKPKPSDEAVSGNMERKEKKRKSLEETSTEPYTEQQVTAMTMDQLEKAFSNFKRAFPEEGYQLLARFKQEKHRLVVAPVDTLRELRNYWSRWTVQQLWDHPLWQKCLESTTPILIDDDDNSDGNGDDLFMADAEEDTIPDSNGGE